MMVHLINCLQFEVQCPDEEQAFNLRHNFAITFQEQIAEAIDTIASKYVGDEEWLRIDKLEIDIGYFTPYTFDAHFAEVFKHKFEKELKQKLTYISPQQRKASLQLSKAEAFQYFLRKGTLPWWADESGIDIDEISADLLTHHAEMLSSFFFKHRSNANVWKRIALQLNTASKSAIIYLLKELKKSKATLNTGLQKISLLIKNETGNTPVIDEAAMDDIIISNAPVIFNNAEDNAVLWQLLIANSAKVFPEIKVVAEQVLQNNKDLFLKMDKEVIDFNPEQKSIVGKAETSNQVKDVFHDEMVDEISTDEDLNKEEKYFVKHSGIVLLALFLKPFFTNLHLLNDTEWKDKDAQYKAIHLLKYVSTGEQKIPEYNLTLEKIMCGVAIEEPIPIDVVLNEEEINEAESLLHAVIEHWKALKHTSLNGLREAFLKRDGILKKQEEGWLLQVEHKTLDVLIESIPWGFSTIVFPWNPYPIFVEW